MAFKGNLEGLRNYFVRYRIPKWVSWNALLAFEVRNKEVLVPEQLLTLQRGSLVLVQARAP